MISGIKLLLVFSLSSPSLFFFFFFFVLAGLAVSFGFPFFFLG